MPLINTLNTEVTMENESKDKLTEARKTYLAGLFSKAAPDGVVREVLNEIKAVKTRKQNMDIINQFTVDKLAETLAFLMGTTMEEASKEMKDEINSYVKKGLVEMVVRTIEKLWTEFCSTCMKEYCTYPEEHMLIRCVRCERGACKDCFEEDMEAFNQLKMRGRGIYFLCTSCVTLVKVQDKIPEVGVKKASKTKQKHSKKVEDDGIPKSQADLFKDNFPCDQCDRTFLEENDLKIHMENSHEEIVVSDNESGEEGDDEEDMSKVSRAEKNAAKKEKQRQKKKENKDKDICIHYEWNRCRNGQEGVGCKFAHPKICPKISREGPSGCKNKTCNLYHPKVCYGSLATPKSCMKEACTYRHLAGTKRPANRKEKEQAKREEEKRKKDEQKRSNETKKKAERETQREDEEQVEGLPTTTANRGNAQKSAAFLEKTRSAQEGAGPVVEMMVELLGQMGKMMSTMQQQQKVYQQTSHLKPAQYEPETQYLLNQPMGAWGRPLQIGRQVGQ